ncbi:MAG: histidine kinase [bacterium]|nr:histidine kinase [bacterium]
MKNWRERLSAMKLNQKLTLLILITLIIPMGFFMMLLFQTISDNAKEEAVRNVEYDLQKSRRTIEQNVEMCSLSTQVIESNQVLNDYLLRFYLNDSFDVKELLNFYHTEINGIEKIVNSNPYLYQIRIYVDSDTMKEMMPLLYNSDRMHQLTWAKEAEIESGVWHFDYTDTLFPEYVLNSTDHIVSLVTTLTDYEEGTYAVAEVATTMQTMFPDIYTTDLNESTCFVDQNGIFYHNAEEDKKWLEYEKSAYAQIVGEATDADCRLMTINHEKLVVGYEYVKVLDGYLIKLVSMEPAEKQLSGYRNYFLLLLALILAALTWAFHHIVKKILHQFYAITDVVHEVQHGDMEIRIPNCGKDEFGVLGKELNEMLDQIRKLMDENVKREILMKDSQIRALQNQINAHFIYNVLESIKMMAEIDEKYEISDAVTSLGKLLRYSMRWNSQSVTVEEEVDYIKNYLALINLRFDYEIFLSLNLPDEILKQEIPKMSLQPIIENAIYHGIEEIAEDTNIYMKGFIEEEPDGTYSCSIKITDSGCGMSDVQVEELQKKINGEIEASGGAGNGIGLKNVQDRIRISFGKDYGLTIASEAGKYTQVAVKIPFVKERRSDE